MRKGTWKGGSMSQATDWAVRDCKCIILQGQGAGVELRLVLHCPAALADAEKSAGGRSYDQMCESIRGAVLASAEAGAVREARRRLEMAQAEAGRCRQDL